MISFSLFYYFIYFCRLLQLPVELMELILMKAAFKLWRDLWTTDSRPNSRVSRTLALVCYDWVALLIERTWIKRHLRKHLKGILINLLSSAPRYLSYKMLTVTLTGRIGRNCRVFIYTENW